VGEKLYLKTARREALRTLLFENRKELKSKRFQRLYYGGKEKGSRMDIEQAKKQLKKRQREIIKKTNNN